jgi:hypothetical protein
VPCCIHETNNGWKELYLWKVATVTRKALIVTFITTVRFVASLLLCISQPLAECLSGNAQQ